eukprot:g1198.t1
MHVRNVDLDVKEEASWAVSFAVMFTVLRWIGNRVFLGHTFITQDKQRLTLAERLFEELWLAVFCSFLLIAAWLTFVNNDVGASIFNTHPTVRGWPMNFVTFDAIVLIRVETGWYLHQMTRCWTASGVPIGSLMFYHHIGTLVIIIFCELTNLLLVGVLTLAVFNISNPFLHISKTAHIMNWMQGRKVLFALFGLAFFLSRIVLLPLTIMKIGLVHAYKEDYKRFGTKQLFIGNAMVLILYVLQIFWMAKIILVLVAGKTGSTPKKSNMKDTVFSETRPLNGKGKDDKED